jgi:WD40 repeat protein
MPIPILTAPTRLYAWPESPDGKFRLEASTGRKTTLIHTASGARLNLNSHAFRCASFAPDSNSFITGHDDGMIRQWDNTGALMYSHRCNTGPITSVAYSPDGTQFAAGSEDGVVSIWDAETQQELGRIAAPATSVSCVRWSPRGDRLAISLGEFNSREVRLQIWDRHENVLTSDEPLERPVGALAWLSDDALLIASWDGQGLVRNLRGNSSDQVITLDRELVSAANWSPDVRLVPTWRADQLAAGAGL